MGYKGNISDDLDEGANSDCFVSAHESDDEGVDDGPFKVKGKKRFSKWIEFDEKNDMKNPRFCLGMIFPNNKVFKHAVRKHGVMTKKELRFLRNTKHMISVKCFTFVDCPYYIAKAKALRLAQCTIEDQYNNLESYTHELKKRNPSCSVWIKTELNKDVTKFQRIYICLSAWKEGWKVGCRPIIGLDGCHLKGIHKGQLLSAVGIDGNNGMYPIAWAIIGLDGCHLKGIHKGQLLSAVGIDGNNGMYPIAWAIVEAKIFDTWTWFLTFLKEDLDIHHSRHYAFMSDKQKGLEATVKNLFLEAEHRFCVRHMHKNFKGDGHIGTVGNCNGDNYG
ncbi:hypothetical protein ACLB2K_061150 [Fragaria x ananassa]